VVHQRLNTIPTRKFPKSPLAAITHTGSASNSMSGAAEFPRRTALPEASPETTPQTSTQSNTTDRHDPFFFFSLLEYSKSPSSCSGRRPDPTRPEESPGRPQGETRPRFSESETPSLSLRTHTTPFFSLPLRFKPLPAGRPRPSVLPGTHPPRRNSPASMCLPMHVWPWPWPWEEDHSLAADPRHRRRRSG
jgi:hypothetical protein